MREFNTIHGFEPARSHTDKLSEIRHKVGNLGGAMDRTVQPLERSAFVQPEYSCPVQNMKAAEAAAAKLPHELDEQLRQQMRRVQELITTANRQQRETETEQGLGAPQPVGPSKAVKHLPRTTSFEGTSNQDVIARKA